MLQIAISYVSYPVTMARFFVEAFKKRKDCSVFTIGPHFGNWIPWPNDDGKIGRYLPDKYVLSMDAPLPRTTLQTKLHPQMVIDILPKDIDLFLQVDAGWHFTARPPGKVVALVETDPHCLKRHYDLPKSYSDLTFCMQSNFMENDEVFLPYAAHDHCYPMDVEKKYDVAMIGVQYEERRALANKLKGMGLYIRDDTGIVFDEYRKIYNQSRCAVSVSSRKDTAIRVWEALSMAVPLVADRTPDLSTFFVENDHYLGFDTLDEAVDKVLWILDNKELAQSMANDAYRKLAFSGHHFDDRVTQILEICKLI